MAFKNKANRLGTRTLSFVLLAILAVSIATTVLGTAQSASALTAATFNAQPSFTSLNSGKWSRVWDNGSGSTYFIDVNGGTFKSVKINSSTGAIQSSATTVVSGTPTTVTTETASSTRTDTIFTQDVGGTTQSLLTGSTTFLTEYLATASSQLVGQTINSMTLYLKKTGVPTGTAIIGCFDSSGNTVIQFGTQDVSLLTTSFVATQFTTTSASRTLANGDRCGVFFNSGSGGNTLDVEYYNADIYDGTSNTIVSTATGAQGAASYTSQTTRELRGSLAYVYSPTRVNTNSPSATQLYENQGNLQRAVQTNYDGSVTLYANTNQVATEKIAGGSLNGVTANALDVYLAKTGSPSGTITAGIWSSGSSSNKVTQSAGTDGGLLVQSTSAIIGASEHLTGSSALVGQTVNSMTVSLKKANSPTGTLTAAVMDSSGNIVYTFGTVDISTLTTSYVSYTFTNTGSSRTLASGDYVGLKGPVQTGANTVSVASTNPNQYDGTNSVASQLGGTTWTDAATWDLGSTSGSWKLDLVTSPTLVYTFGTLSASTLTTSVAKYRFENTGASATITATQYVGVQYASGDASNNIQVSKASADSFGGTTNAIYSTWLTGWTDTTTSDLTFRLVLSASQNVESGSWIKGDFGSNQSVQAMYVYFSDANKIPQTVNMLTSTDDITYTSQANVTLSQSTGAQFVSWPSSVTARYVKMQVVTWGSAKSVQLESYTRAVPIGINSVISGVETVAGVNRVYYAQLQSTVSVYLAIINVDTGATIQTATQSITAVGSSSDYTGLAVSPNGIWFSVKGAGTGGYQVFYGSRALGAMTQAGSLSTGLAGSMNTPCEMAADGASQAQDVVYCVVAAGSGQQGKLYKATTALVSAVGNVGSANAATAIDLADVSGKMIIRVTTSDGITTTQTVDKSSGILSSSLYSQAWNTWTKQQYSFNGSTRSYMTGSIAYFATPSKSISFTATSGTLNDPAQMYIETVDSGTATLSGISSTFYRVNDALVVYGSGTTWTPKTISGAAISPTMYSERLQVPLTQNSTVFSLNVVKVACDAPYTFYMSAAYVGDDSDCSVWRVYDTPTATIGRELPYTRTQNLVHASDLTNYGIHTLVATGKSSDYYLYLVYDGRNADRSQFDATDNAQLRLLYGQCYTLEYVKVLDGSVVQSNRLCADDTIFKSSILSTDLGFTFWSSVWSGYHTYNSTSNIVTTIARHSSQPYNYTISLYNGTGTLLSSTPHNGINQELDTQNTNVTSYLSQKPLRVVLTNQDGHKFYEAWIATEGNWLAPISQGWSNIQFAGFQIIWFIPIIFASIFTRSTAGIGGGMLVALIGCMVFFGVLPSSVITPTIMGLLVFVAIVGILAYRFLYS